LNKQSAIAPWARQYRTRWRKYLYSIIGAEISATNRFCDECIQISPEQHDTGLLFDAVDCPSKSFVSGIQDVPDHHRVKNKRFAFLFNGNFNYMTDIQHQLQELFPKLSRHSRLFIIAYNPYFALLYSMASLLGLRKAPEPDVFLAEKDLQMFAKLTEYEIIRIRPSVFVPFYLPVLSNLINRVFPIIPVLKRLSLVWVVVLRPIIPEKRKPSLSIIIPARNESGNIDNALQRIPSLPGTDIEVIFVEGHSTDNTWQSIKDVKDKYNKRFKVAAYQQPGKGKNDAVRVGFENAIGELVTILDADLTMPPEMLPRFYEAYCQGKGDVINGSRLIYPMEGGAMRSLNRLGNIFFCKILAWVLGVPISDSLCGTKLFSLHDYRRFIVWRNSFGDFDPFGDFEMLFAASELALGVVDVPVRYHARTYGDTNISRFRNGIELIRMTTIGFFRIFMGKIK